jgi:hypothetical protein
MANIFDQFDTPSPAAPSPAEPGAPPAAPPVNVFDQFDAAPPATTGVDWSKYNQPLGELKPYDPSFTQGVTDIGQDVLMKAGVEPYRARHLSEGAVGIGTLAPPIGSVLSGGDLIYDVGRGNYGHAALDALGVLPGAIAGRRLIRGMPTAEMAEVPGVTRANRYEPGVDQLKVASDTAYDAVRNSPVVYHPSMLDDMINNMRVELTRRGLNPAKAPSTFGVLDAASAPKPRGAIVTPDDLDTLRQQLRGGVPGTQDSFAGGLAVDLLDRHMANPPPQHLVSGTRQDLDTLGRDLETARGNWRAYKTADAVEGKIDTSAIQAAIANSGKNLDNTTRQYLAALIKTKTGQRAIPGALPAEKQAIEEAATGDWLTNAQRYGGKFLGGGGGWGQAATSSIGGGAGTAAGVALGLDPLSSGAIGTMATGGVILGGSGLRAAADARTRAAATEVANLIRRNSPEYVARAARTPPITDPMAMRRDAIAYAMIPQARQAGAGIWDQLNIPYENRSSGNAP